MFEYAGISCLDFEDYLPEYNLFLKDPYQNETDAHIQRLHPTWSTEQVKAEAKKTFDDKAKHYFKVNHVRDPVAATAVASE